MSDAATITRPLQRYRNHLAVLIHLAIFAVSLFTAFELIYNFQHDSNWFNKYYLPLLGMVLPIKLLVFWRMRQLRTSWRFVGLRDLIGVCTASYISTFLFIVLFFVLEYAWRATHGGAGLIARDPVNAMPQTVFLLDLAATIGFSSAARVGARMYYEEIRQVPLETATRLLVVGSGNAGEAALREIQRMPVQRYHVVGYLDEDPTRQGASIHGVEVLGSSSDVRSLCEAHNVDEVLIAISSATPRDIRAVVERCEGINVRFRTIPALADLIEGRVQVSQIRAVEVEDLLGRDPVRLDTDAIGAILRGRRVLVTGAGGSIGSEMCRQIARFRPETLILVEQAENNLFEIDRELRQTFPELDVIPYVADICDLQRLRWVFDQHKPAAVFHAAAHKHVPMMEINPGEAIKNNVLGTKQVADTAVACGVGKVVIISTDKAVNPTSIMGCSKRVAEMYVQQLSARGETQFVTVRFGNVLGSSGSVVQIFREQIASGGPLTVTHEEMTRYFMTIPEASQLVLQAGTMGRGGEIMVLDMGEPVKIIDLARDMITLSGLRPHEDIDIVITGMRPGEKLFEELSIEGEDVSRTSHPKIGIWRNKPENWNQVCKGIEGLLALAEDPDLTSMQAGLKALVPEYTPAGTPAEACS
ncbi:MAG: polysaccharide biosynthesis protein [Planctomycetes bacterium]|nr:polysaccharide biosynthesis protein [Planctomycetota bacterium]